MIRQETKSAHAGHLGSSGVELSYKVLRNVPGGEGSAKLPGAEIFEDALLNTFGGALTLDFFLRKLQSKQIAIFFTICLKKKKQSSPSPSPGWTGRRSNRLRDVQRGLTEKWHLDHSGTALLLKTLHRNQPTHNHHSTLWHQKCVK